MANQEIKDQTSGKKKSYSVNRVVNAIVFAKAHEANKNGIALKTELKIPAELEIDPLDLCRILEIFSIMPFVPAFNFKKKQKLVIASI